MKMNRFDVRFAIVFTLCLALLALGGCHAERIGENKGDEYNSALSPQQKAALDAHKKAGEQ